MLRKLLLIMLGLIIITACAKKMNEPVDILCMKNINRANTMLTEQQKNMTNNEIRTIKNLIKAAMIQQQHDAYAACNDRAYRAIDMMQPNREK